MSVVHYVVRIVLAHDRAWNWSRHLHDLAIIALPLLRPRHLLPGHIAAV